MLRRHPHILGGWDRRSFRDVNFVRGATWVINQISVPGRCLLAPVVAGAFLPCPNLTGPPPDGDLLRVFKP